MKKGIIINIIDNIATVLEDIKSEEIIRIYDLNNELIDEIVAIDNIPYGNKILLRNIACGEDILKYGERIGEAEKTILKGQLVHVHNIKSYSIDIPDSVKLEVMRKMDL